MAPTVKKRFFIVIDKRLRCKWVVVHGVSRQYGDVNGIRGDVLVRGPVAEEGELNPVHERHANRFYVISGTVLAVQLH